MINKYFSKITNEILNQEGWYENRYLEKEINMLQDRGYDALESFKKFYSEFGRIEIYNPQKIENDRYISFILEKSFIGYEALNRIGSINGEVALVIDGTSKIYSLYDRSLSIIGENIYNAIENLCTNEWRWFDQFTIDTEQKWNDQIIDWKYVRAKEIENYKEFIKKYPNYKSFYE